MLHLGPGERIGATVMRWTLRRPSLSAALATHPWLLEPVLGFRRVIPLQAAKRAAAASKPERIAAAPPPQGSTAVDSSDTVSSTAGGGDGAAGGIGEANGLSKSGDERTMAGGGATGGGGGGGGGTGGGTVVGVAMKPSTLKTEFGLHDQLYVSVNARRKCSTRYI